MSANVQSADDLFELGSLYKDRCDYGLALEKIEAAAGIYLDEGNYKGYLDSIHIALRIYAEKSDVARIDSIKEKLQDLVIKERITLNAQTYYILGLCASYKGQFKTSLEYLEKALGIALADDDKENICRAINGIAIVYAQTGRYEEALKELYNLQVFFQVLPLKELQLSSLILNGTILRKLGKLDQALNIYWQAYDLLSSVKNQAYTVQLLYAIGVTYKEQGEPELARLYLTLIKKTADSEDLKKWLDSINKELTEIGFGDESSFDLIFSQASKSVKEKRKGKVDFKNQFILLDLLRLFLEHPGKVYSKENLVEKVWKQSYDPRVHDNKIYVTIKRLRKMIEPDYDKPKYIFRAKNGYYLNKNTRVLMS